MVDSCLRRASLVAAEYDVAGYQRVQNDGVGAASEQDAPMKMYDKLIQAPVGRSTGLGCSVMVIPLLRMDGGFDQRFALRSLRRAPSGQFAEEAQAAQPTAAPAPRVMADALPNRVGLAVVSGALGKDARHVGGICDAIDRSHYNVSHDSAKTVHQSSRHQQTWW
jgi:hypothetical protein